MLTITKHGATMRVSAGAFKSFYQYSGWTEVLQPVETEPVPESLTGNAPDETPGTSSDESLDTEGETDAPDEANASDEETLRAMSFPELKQHAALIDLKGRSKYHTAEELLEAILSSMQ